MIRRRISLTRVFEIVMFGNCPEKASGFRLSCLMNTRPCQC